MTMTRRVIVMAKTTRMIMEMSLAVMVKTMNNSTTVWHIATVSVT